MENIVSLSTTRAGATTIITESNIVLELSPKASAELASHLLRALNVTLTLTGEGRRFTAEASVPKE